MIYLSFEEMLVIHQQVVAQHGGTFGLHSRERLEAALNRPSMNIEGYEPFPGLWSKTAALFDSLIECAPFIHANPATALVAADMMLRRNGYFLESHMDDGDIVRSVGLRQLTLPQIADWFKSRSQPLPDL